MANDRQIIIEIDLDSEDARKKAEALSKSIAKQRNEQAKLRKALKDTQKALNDNEAELDDLIKANKDLDKQLKAGTITNEEYTSAVSANNSAIEENKRSSAALNDELGSLAAQQNLLSQSVKESGKRLREYNKEANVVAGSLNEQRLQISKYKKELGNLDRTTAEGAARFDELTGKIANLTGTVKNAEEATGDFRRNVGNYKNSVVEALNSTEAYNGVLGDLVGIGSGAVDQLKGLSSVIGSFSFGFESSSKAGKAFSKSLDLVGKAIIATGVGALVIALVTLVTALSKTKTGAELLGKATAVVNGVFSELFKILDVVLKQFINLITTVDFDKIFSVKSVEDFGKAILDNIVDVFKSVISAAGLLGKALSNLLAGDFDKAKESAKGAADEISKGFTGKTIEENVNAISDAVDNAGEAFTNFGGRVADAAKKALALNAAIKSLEKTQIALEGSIAKSQATLELLSATADDNTLSFKDRNTALEASIKTSEELADKELKLAKTGLAIASAKFQQAKGTADEVEALKELQTAQNEVQVAEINFDATTRDLAQQRRELRRDEFEQRLDFAIDASDAEKTILERRLADETRTIEQRKKLLEDLKATVNSSVQEQLKLFKEQTDQQINLNELAAESDAAALNAKVQNLGLGEVETQRLLEVIKEYKIANEDVADAEKDLAKDAADLAKRRVEANRKLLESELADDATTAERKKEIQEQLFNDELAALKSRFEQGLILEEEYNAELAALNAKATEDVKANEEEKQQALEETKVKREKTLAAISSALDTFESLAATRSEEEKERIKQDAAEKSTAQKAFALGAAGINTYLAASQTLADPTLPFIAKVVAVASTIATGLANVAKIQGITFADGGMLQGKSHKEGGIKGYAKSFGMFEAEGGEYITNKKATSNNLAALRTINTFGRNTKFNVVPAFADGGELSTNTITNTTAPSAFLASALNNLPTPVVSVSEINKVNNRVVVTENTATI